MISLCYFHSDEKRLEGTWINSFISYWNRKLLYFIEKRHYCIKWNNYRGVAKGWGDLGCPASKQHTNLIIQMVKKHGSEESTCHKSFFSASQVVTWQVLFTGYSCPNQQIKANHKQTGVKANRKQTRKKANCKKRGKSITARKWPVKGTCLLLHTPFLGPNIYSGPCNYPGCDTVWSHFGKF